ncbi:MAG: SAM-dependent methyltransferase [Ruminococcaceae bacterium]|nr:SAM-dependent methyltransferase [Oscillospiraceae bacterium]
MKKVKLTRRLTAAFTLIREGKTVADIGTDHAYLPIALVTEGKCKKAYASDVGKGPLERAKENIAQYGFGDKIETVLTDGAAYFDGIADEFVIAGMGGELIYRIISQAPFLKNKEIHMVLQPMTKVPFLREALLKDGFFIEKEALVKEDGKIYTVMSVYFDGVQRSITPLDALVGNVSDAIEDGNAKLMCDLISLLVHDLDNRIYGKREAGEDTSDENTLRRKLTELRSRLNENM